MSAFQSNPDAQTLFDGIARLSSADQSFAASLLAQLERKGWLSEKQAHWLGVLAGRVREALAPAAPAARIEPSLTGVVELLRRGGESLQRPFVVLSSEEAGSIRVSVAGPSSREPGTLVVTTAGAYETRAYLGRIRLDGTWVGSAVARELNQDAILELLSRFAADPATVAAEYGRLMGSCSFCSRPLSDERSTSVGYGPICAERYGLAWG